MAEKKVKLPNFKRDFVDRRAKQTDNIGGVIDRMKGMTTDKETVDSYANLIARLGIQADNMSSQSYYSPGPYISRNRLELEAGYRGNWLIGKVVDCIAEDMTRDGITMNSESSPDDINKLQVAISKFRIWHDLCNTIKWARLYGGAIAVMIIDGADYTKPLDVDKVGKGKFKGLIVLDRWMIQPTIGELIKDISRDIGMPKYYEVLPGISTFPAMKIHHSRVLRFEGIELPYYQKIFENYWGLSVVERMLDRLVAFDSATLGAAQLLYKAHLRVINVKGFREALAIGGAQETAILKWFQYIRAMQCNEGLTVLDSEDTFATHSYAFSGVSDALQQLGQQISGSEDIPLVRLFGQSPAGFATGDADIRNYYDHILRRQENELRPNLETLLAVMHNSELGKPLPEDFEFNFVHLWQLSEKEKSDIALQVSTTVSGAIQQNIISKKTALLELQQNSRVTGIFTNITSEDIKEAEEEPPPLAPEIEAENPESTIKANKIEAENPESTIKANKIETGEEPASKESQEPQESKENEEPTSLRGNDRLSFRDIKEDSVNRKELIKERINKVFSTNVETDIMLDNYKKKS